MTDSDDMDDDARIDAFHEGWDANKRGEPRPDNPDAAEGWDLRESEKGVVVVMPARPEGYYHMPLGTFD